VRLKNLWDLSDSTTVELGVGGIRGESHATKAASPSVKGSAYEGDLTLKWRPMEGGKYHAFVWSTEYLNGQPAGTERLGGIASWVQYQFDERWWIQGRAEKLGLPSNAANPAEQRQSALLGFFPSEFSGLRLQYDHVTGGTLGKTEHDVAFQWNFSIGAHPAHLY
jgi:hypothetical protein